MGSENFAPDKRYGLFPAVSLGWIVSEENFLKNNKVLRHLKIRGSYGLVGNDVIGGDRFLFEQYYRYPAAYFFGTGNTSSSTLTEGQLANPDISWEKDKKLNVGVDALLFGRLDVTVDVFRNNRYDILATPNSTLPGFFGVDLPLLNEGRVNNKGFEAVLQLNSKPSAGFRYVLGASAWYAKNKIINMSEQVNQFSYQNRTGLSIDQPFGLEAIGFFKDAADISASPKQNFASVMPGDVKYKDQNGDGVIDISDNVSIGSTMLPELNFGFNAAFGYKGFDFAMLVQAVTGRSTYLTGREFQAFQNNGNISPIALGRWTPATAETATYPRLTASNNLNNFRYSSFWQNDGSFVNLRSVELGYTVRKDLMEKISISEARVFINGTNLLSLDGVAHSDAENASGYVGYPSVRTISMGLRIGF
jgi:TonB-linked SusC/RagA family outer membrane protein